MKRFSTLLTAAAVFLTVQTNAQTPPPNYSENFEAPFSSSSHGCWDVSTLLYTTTTTNKDYVINGNGSAYVEPPTSATDIRTFATPYLSLSSTVDISFVYMLTSKLAGSATRALEVGLIDLNGNFTTLDPKFNIADNTDEIPYAKSFPVPAGLTVARVAIRLSGTGGDGNSRVAIDDVAVNAPLYYTSGCNTAPVAIADNFTTSGEFTGNIFNNPSSSPDYDANAGETFTATIVSPIDATLGTLNLNPATGVFTFTPTAEFETVGSATFSYTITDNGYTPATSTAVTVRIAYTPAAVSLPIKLMSFAGSINSNKAQLRWSVADNETGYQFQVLRSSDARTFTEAGTVFISNKPGAESYTFNDSRELDAVTYYKLKIINKDGSVSYSNVIALKSASTKPATGINIMQNPVESTLTFTYSATTATQGQLAIYNTLGVKVYSQRISSQKGTNSVSLNLDSHLAAGTYILEVVNGADRATTRMIKR